MFVFEVYLGFVQVSHPSVYLAMGNGKDADLSVLHNDVGAGFLGQVNRHGEMENSLINHVQKVMYEKVMYTSLPRLKRTEPTVIPELEIQSMREELCAAHHKI